MSQKSKPIILLDFDGCIHSYKSGWQGVTKIPDPPVPGVFEWIENALVHFDIYVYGYRSGYAVGRNAMWEYIRDHSSETLANRLEYVDRKPRAHITIDDRSFCFTGHWDDPRLDPEYLGMFKPWNR